MSEEQILAELRSGSQKALRTLFDTYYTRLTHYAIRVIGDPSASEEIVQDVFISVWNNRQKSEIKDANSYLTRAVKNRCINHINANHPIHDEVDNFLSIAADFSADTSLESAELAGAIDLAEKQLPKQTALVFGLSRHTELTYPQISEELNISVKTVEYHISKALKLIREFLIQKEILLVLLTSLIV